MVPKKVSQKIVKEKICILENQIKKYRSVATVMAAMELVVAEVAIVGASS